MPTAPFPTWWEPERRKLWEDWLASRPMLVRRAARAYPPWNVYLLKSSGHLVTLYSYDELEDELDPDSVGVKVVVGFDLNPDIGFERTVFGIKLSDLEFVRERRPDEFERSDEGSL